MEEDSNEEVAPVGRLESFILNSNPSTQIATPKPTISEQRLYMLEQKLEEQGEQIKELKSENESLKKQLNEAFQNIITIYNKLNKTKKVDKCCTKLEQLNLTLLYHSMDDQLYKLEDSYKTLNHDIIKSRAEFGLINLGIKHQLKKNIAKCELKYKASVDGKNKDIFHNKCDDILYQLLIIKTTNDRRFGIFFCNKGNNNNNYYNSLSNDSINIINKRNNDNFNFNKDNNLLHSYRSYSNFHYMNNYNNYFNSDNNLLLFRNNNNINTLSINLSNYDKDKSNQIFNCKEKPEKFFAFSLNQGKNYFLNNKNINNTPCFSIYFDPNRESFYGKEKKINVNSQVKDFVLSGKEEFNILEFEVYEIDI